MSKKKVTEEMMIEATSIRKQITEYEEKLTLLFADCSPKDVEKAYQGVFRREAEFLFEKHLVLTSFGWTQGTPGFNDGDPCTFRVHLYDETCIYINGKNGDNYDSVEFEKLEQTFSDVHEFIEGYKSSDLQDWFGDGVKITIKRSGIVRIEDYDCN